MTKFFRGIRLRNALVHSVLVIDHARRAIRVDPGCRGPSLTGSAAIRPAMKDFAILCPRAWLDSSVIDSHGAGIGYQSCKSCGITARSKATCITLDRKVVVGSALHVK